MFFLRAVICPFNSLVVLFTLSLNFTNHVCLEGGPVEFHLGGFPHHHSWISSKGTSVADQSHESLESVQPSCRNFDIYPNNLSRKLLGNRGFRVATSLSRQEFHIPHSTRKQYACSEFSKDVFSFKKKMAKWQASEIIPKRCLFIIVRTPPVAWQPRVWIVTSERTNLAGSYVWLSRHPHGAWSCAGDTQPLLHPRNWLSKY